MHGALGPIIQHLQKIHFISKILVCIVTIPISYNSICFYLSVCLSFYLSGVNCNKTSIKISWIWGLARLFSGLKYLLCKPDNPNLIPRIHGGIRDPAPQSCSLTSTWCNKACVHLHTHTHTQCIYKRIELKISCILSTCFSFSFFTELWQLTFGP